MPFAEIMGELAEESFKEASSEVKDTSVMENSLSSEFSESSFNEDLTITDRDIASFQDTLQSFRDCVLPDKAVTNAVHRACEFFGIPEVPVIEADGTCVWTNDASTIADDLFGFNREQLMEMGVSGEDSLTLVYTHECAHRCLQNAFIDSWTEELACDYFSGVHAGLNNINLDNFEASLGCTEGGTSHPSGALRAQFIEAGRQAALEMEASGTEISFDNCMNKLNQYLQEKQGLIAEYRERVEDKMFTDQSFSGGDISFKGFVDDKEWNMKQANYNFEQAKWHEKEAAKAVERGDHSAAKDHLRTAQSYNSKGNDYLKDANNSKK
ncbi:MAG: hypothetical protein MR641_00710 [Bacteroidales bacterium]|nr:hypothetical protein [Bacteroidales bacterium]